MDAGPGPGGHEHGTSVTRETAGGGGSPRAVKVRASSVAHGAWPTAQLDYGQSRLKIYTKGGDGGETTLLGGARVPKDDARVAAYGTVDELNAVIGAALAFDADGGALDDSAAALGVVQEDLFTIGARLAASNPARSIRVGSIPVLPSDRIDALEAWIDRLTDELPALEAFVLPGGSPVAAQLHVARTVCRRAERGVVALLEDQPDLGEAILPYLNRLSDLLFTLARYANRRAGREDMLWLPQRQRDDSS